ncbi:MAG TPA: hypothetical protein VLE97_10885 [Gaiellaceae bacterium]|nr:hypothetical protein [Gaiellaceae bacterium]
MTPPRSLRNQLAYLDQLVPLHENYWTAVAQYNPLSGAVHEFWIYYWGPWSANWIALRPRLDLAAADEVAAFVHEFARGLSSVRAWAAYTGIPIPDLETPQFVESSSSAENTLVGGILDDIAQAAKNVFKDVASFIHHPPEWFAIAFPLFTTENQRYWAKKLGGSTGAQIYDAGVKAIAAKYLGPQGPALVETYNKVVEDAAKGNLDAKTIIEKAPQIAKLAAASKKGADAFRAAVSDTKSAVKTSGG